MSWFPPFRKVRETMGHPRLFSDMKKKKPPPKQGPTERTFHSVVTYSTSRHPTRPHAYRSKSETRYGRSRRICVPVHSRCARASGTYRSHHYSAPRNI